MGEADAMHVVPLADLIEHDTSGEAECVCGPRHELVETEYGDRWLVVHASLDGRELHEKAADE